jgi:2-oxoglutarate ferredoxin oxidoreductase subunit alpha
MVDVLVAMNAAALKVNLTSLKKAERLIANTDGFDAKNLRGQLSRRRKSTGEWQS